jgi:ubiquinone/menaquinone biosynthesis C-methylase UbiE
MQKGLAMSTENPPNENTYPVSPESGAEMARLIDQDKIITDTFGRLPSKFKLRPGDQVLDIACGPGGWGRSIAATYSQTDVMGVDISQTMIGYANNYVQAQKIPNLHFRVMDITQPWNFADASFDVVNARAMASFLNKQRWEHVISEIMRVLTPGGSVILTEPDDIGRHNSAALDRYEGFLWKAFYRAGISHHPTGGPHMALTPMLGAYLRKGGFEHIQQEALVIDYSANTPAHDILTDDFHRAFLLLQPFFLKLGTATQEEIDVTLEQVLKDFASPDFRILWYWLRIWGQKPA